MFRGGREVESEEDLRICVFDSGRPRREFTNSRVLWRRMYRRIGSTGEITRLNLRVSVDLPKSPVDVHLSIVFLFFPILSDGRMHGRVYI